MFVDESLSYWTWAALAVFSWFLFKLLFGVDCYFNNFWGTDFWVTFINAGKILKNNLVLKNVKPCLCQSRMFLFWYSDTMDVKSLSQLSHWPLVSIQPLFHICLLPFWKSPLLLRNLLLTSSHTKNTNVTKLWIIQ